MLFPFSLSPWLPLGHEIFKNLQRFSTICSDVSLSLHAIRSLLYRHLAIQFYLSAVVIAFSKGLPSRSLYGVRWTEESN
jgi:hypothetical protein